MSFAGDIQSAANGEPIEAIIIGAFGWSDGLDDPEPYGIGPDQAIPRSRLGVVLPWSEARSLLAYEYNSGFGAPNCHAIHAWTASRVLFVMQYDGSTSIRWVPRNPPVVGSTPVLPEMPGG